MSTLTIDRRSNHYSGLHAYARNVGEAGRSLLAALLAVKPNDTEPAVAEASAAVAAPATAHRKTSLIRLYQLSVQSDSVSQAVANELRQIAAAKQ
jgi:hypothetical protein